MDRNDQDPAAAAREIIDANRYMTIATADAEGRPWAAPVWYAHEDWTDFLWVSRPDARHSRNLAARPALAIVIFDSTVPVGAARAVYVEGVGEELGGAELARGIAVFSRRSVAQGAGEWLAADVVMPAPLRLYRARASEHSVLGGDDRRTVVRLG